MGTRSGRGPRKVPLRQALFWVLGSTFLFTGLALTLFWFQRRVLEARLESRCYALQHIVQRVAKGPALESECLAELLGLSSDKQTNLLAFDPATARRALLDTGLFASVELSTAPPGSLIIGYRLRQPVAYLDEYTNTGVDAGGSLFPIRPFQEMQELPRIVLGLPGLSDLDALALPERRSLVAIDLAQRLRSWNVRRIDTSRMELESEGRREVVVSLEEPCFTSVLRLCPERIEEGLAHYRILRDRLSDEDTAGAVVVDLRSERLALIEYLGEEEWASLS